MERWRAPSPSLSYITLSLLLYLPTIDRFSTFHFPNYPTFPILFPLPSTLTSLPYLPKFPKPYIPLSLSTFPFPLNRTHPYFSPSPSISFPNYPLPYLSTYLHFPFFSCYPFPFHFLFSSSFSSLFCFPFPSFPLLLGLWFPLWLFTL